MIIARPNYCLVYGKISNIINSGDVTTVTIDAEQSQVELDYDTSYIKRMKPKVGGKVLCTTYEVPELFILADGGVLADQKVHTKGLSIIYSGTFFIRGEALFKNLELVLGTVVRSDKKENSVETLVTYRVGKANNTKAIKGNIQVQEGQKHLFLQETTEDEGGPFWATKIV